ncbi:protease complex subunit PrcB family protein [Nonlabens dokdonensis]|nr:protease complex subunit PrcB family protein [Nonlabens dokdonensis]
MKDLTLKTSTEEFVVFMEDSNTNIMEQTTMIISSQKELETFFTVFNATKNPKVDLPIVDFKNQSVLVAGMGQKSSGGYSFQEPEVVNKKTKTYNFKVISPGPKDLVTMSLTTPGMIVIANQPAEKVKINLVD